MHATRDGKGAAGDEAAREFSRPALGPRPCTPSAAAAHASALGNRGTARAFRRASTAVPGSRRTPHGQARPDRSIARQIASEPQRAARRASTVGQAAIAVPQLATALPAAALPATPLPATALRAAAPPATVALVAATPPDAVRALSRCACGAAAPYGRACSGCTGRRTATLDAGTAALARAVAARRTATLDAGTAALARAVAARRPAETPPDRVLARDTTVHVDVAPNGCTLDQHHAIEPAVNTASAWLRQSIALLDAFIANPTADATAATRRALRRNFASTAVADATTVRGRFATILNDMLTSTALRSECHTNADTTCGAANAYVNGSLFVFCPIFFQFDPLGRASSVVHEMAHALTAGPHITDRAYRSNRYYRWMTSAEALTNAESYGILARELGTGTQVADDAAHDTIEDCPPDWDLALARSAAIAERWNRNAQTALRDRGAGWLAGWADLQTRHLGATTTSALDNAQRVYDAAQSAFQSNIDFECEPGATGGRCARYLTYWYGWLSDFHICPSWMALPTEERRTEALLAGYYGYKDIVGDEGRRHSLAALAHELNDRYHPAPAPAPPAPAPPAPTPAPSP